MAKPKWDRAWEQHSIGLAAKSRHKEERKDHPEVGAVLVDSRGELIGASFHGEHDLCDHAEYSLLEKTDIPDPLPSGTTLYTTLEPCSERRHELPGGTQKIACAEWVAERNIDRVVVGMMDPLIGAEGARILAQAHIAVEFFHPEHQKQTVDLNRVYLRDKRDIDTNHVSRSSLEVYMVAKLAAALASASEEPRFWPELDEQTKQHQVPYQETREYSYWVGCDESGDRAHLGFSTKATGKKPLLWRRLIISCTTGPDQIPALREMNLRVGGRAASILPVKQTARGVVVLVSFDRPIGRKPVNWSLEYDWPHLWNPYRETGTDTGSFSVGTHCPEIQLTVTFEDGFESTPTQFHSRYPEEGETNKGTEESTQGVLRWTVREPEPQLSYMYRIDHPGGGPPSC